jgi:hydrogenase expression/formation protein HypE
MKNDAYGPDDVILMGHGGGGLLTSEIISRIILRELGNPILNKLDDAACLTIEESDIVLTTDSFVVDPIFFPGGDIGKLAVCGTVNDLAMQGAKPKYLSLALIIEEGLRIGDLERIIRSVGSAVKEAGVSVVTGDTKVIERSRDRTSGDSGIYVNTTGIGTRMPGVDVSVSNAVTGDAVIVTGSIGDHGIAIMNERDNLGFQSELTSDAAPLSNMITPLLEEVPTIHCLRDPTRGGVSAALVDIAASSSCGIQIEESAFLVKKEVVGACDVLGLDVLNVANEGKAIALCATSDREAVLECLRSHALGRESRVVGHVVDAHPGGVHLNTVSGGERIVRVPTGEDLPRIC